MHGADNIINTTHGVHASVLRKQTVRPCDDGSAIAYYNNYHYYLQLRGTTHAFGVVFSRQHVLQRAYTQLLSVHGNIIIIMMIVINNELLGFTSWLVVRFDYIICSQLVSASGKLVYTVRG